MPRGREAPATYSADWPRRPCSDPTAEKVRLFALAVRSALDGRSLRGVARDIGMDNSVLSDLLAGRSWPDAQTIGRLEIGLDASLWPAHQSAERIHAHDHDQASSSRPGYETGRQLRKRTSDVIYRS